MINEIKIYFIFILFKLYIFFKFNFLLVLIQNIGGPVFSKILQSFHEFNIIQIKNCNDGTIGKIKKSGDIIVKSLHSNIQTKFDNSFNLMKQFILFLKINIPFDFNEYKKINMNQFNLIIEDQHSKQLKKIFENISNVNIIDIFESNETYHFSKFIDGFSVNDFINKYPEHKDNVIKLIYLSYYLMLLKNNFHCDWHLGNFIISLDNNNPVLNILDTGIMGKLNEEKDVTRLRNFLTVNLLKPDKLNIIKFLCFVNKNNNASIKDFIIDSKNIINKDYKNFIVGVLWVASKNKLIFPIVILYMLQGLIFIDSLTENYNEDYQDILEFSKNKGFYAEIQKL